MQHWPEAETLNRELMTAKTENLGPTHRSTLTTLSNLSWALSNQGPAHWAEAEALAKQLMEISIDVFGEQDVDTLVSEANLATIWYRQGRVVMSAQLHVRALEGKMRFGEEGGRDIRDSEAWVEFLRGREEEGALRGVRFARDLGL